MFKKLLDYESRMFCSADDKGDETSSGGSAPEVQDSGPDADDKLLQDAAEVSELLKKPGDERLGIDDIRKMISLDPIAAKKAAERKQAAKEPPTPPKTQTKAKAPTLPLTKTPQPPKEEKPPLDPNVSALVKSVEKLTQTKEAPPPPKETPKSYYGGLVAPLEIEPRIMEYLDSDDPNERLRGMNTIINGVAEQVHQDVMSYVHQAFLPAVVQEAVQRSMAAYQQIAFENLMGEVHPILVDPNFRNIVQTFGKQLAEQKQQAGVQFKFDRGFLEELLPMVLTYIQTTTGTPLPSPTPMVKSPSAPRVNGGAPYIPERSARPPASDSGFSESADFLDMVGIAPRKPN